VQISSIIDIVEGELLNSPSISFIYNIKTQINKIHEGDLFIASNEYEIQNALSRGAFGILYDFDTNIVDNEIAWIKVKSINYAISKLIRYKLSNLDLEAFYCNKITYEILSLFIRQNDENIRLISNDFTNEIDLFDNFENIDNVKTIICQNKEKLDGIYPNNSNFNHTQYAVKNLLEHSLFETTFSCGKSYFPRLKLPSLYINNFLEVYSFLNNDLDVNRLKKIDSFRPLFIDKYFKLIEYGSSDKFILSHTDVSQATIEIKHLKDKYTYAKTFIFAKGIVNMDNEYIDHRVSNLVEIKDFLHTKKFNAVYIIGFTKEEITNFITKNSTLPLL